MKFEEWRQSGKKKIQLNLFTQKSIINLSLYLAGVKSDNIKEFHAEIEKRYRSEVNVELKSVNPDEDFWNQENNLVISDLCGLPQWEIRFSLESVKLLSDSDELDRLYSIALSVYRSCLHREWNVCLYDSNAKAVAVEFDDNFACKVAHLFNMKESSDKVYHLYLIEESKDTYRVVIRYGRRGKSLKTAQKSFESFEDTEKEWQGIYNSKLRKGYEIGKPILQQSWGFGVISDSTLLDLYFW